MNLREPAYAVLSAVLAFLTLLFAMLTVFFLIAGIRGALNPAIPEGGAKFGATIICVVVAMAFGLAAAVCAHFTLKAMRVANNSGSVVQRAKSKFFHS